MRKNILFVVALACLFNLSLMGQERIAVIPFTGGDAGEGDTIARLLGTEIAKSGSGFKVVPRTAAMSAISKEQKFQRTGLTDGDTIGEVGRAANASYVVTGHIQKLGNEKLVIVSMTEVETLHQTAGAYYTYNDLGEMRSKLSSISDSLIEYTIHNTKSTLPTLAVLPFDIVVSSGVNEVDAEVLAQILACEIANSGKYAVMLRTTTIERIMKEQNIQRSGLTDSETIKKIGEAVNAEYVLAGFVSKLGSDTLMDTQVLHTETGDQLTGGSVEYSEIGDGVSLMPDLSYQITDIIKNKEGALKIINRLLEEKEGESGISAIKSLLNRGNVNIKDDDGDTALILASWNGYTEIVKVLIQAGAQVNTKDNGGDTALILASYSGNTDIAKDLIEAGASLDMQDNAGWTALIYASRNGRIEVVRALIAAGADLNIKNNSGSTALIDASSSGHTEIVRLLKAAGAR